MAHKSDFDKFYYFIVVTGVVVLLANLYYYAHPFWKSLGWTHEIADSLMVKLRVGGTFSGPWKTKALAMGLFAISLITRYGKGKKTPWWLIGAGGAIGCALYLLPIKDALLYIISTVAGTGPSVPSVATSVGSMKPRTTGRRHSSRTESFRIPTTPSIFRRYISITRGFTRAGSMS